MATKFQDYMAELEKKYGSFEAKKQPLSEEDKIRGYAGYKPGQAVPGNVFGNAVQSTANAVAAPLGAAETTFTGGLLGATPGLRAADIMKGIPTGPYSAEDIMSGRGAPQPFSAGTDRQLLDRLTDQSEQLRKDRETLEFLQGPYGVLGNDALPQDQRAQYQAQYDLLKQTYGEDVTGESLFERQQEMEGRIAPVNDRVTMQQDLAYYAGLSEDEKLAMDRYAEALRLGAVSFDSSGKITSPVLTAKGQPEIIALMEKYGEKRVTEVAETLKRISAEELAQELQQLGYDVGKTLGIGAMPLDVGLGIINTPANLIGLANEAITGTGRYSTANPYNAMGGLGQLAGGIGTGAAEKTPEQLVDLLELMGNANPYSTEMASFNATPGNYTPQIYDSLEGTKAGEVVDTIGGGAYNVVKNAADSVARAYMGGLAFGPGTTGAKVMSLGLAGSRSFGDTFNEVSAKGGTPAQAVALGVFNGGTEIATEYIPLDNWWKTAEKGSEGLVPMLKAAAKQGGIEMVQEEIGFLATTMAEFAVLREKSEYQVLIRDLQEMGYTEEQAERMAWQQFGEEALGVAAQSFFSGGLSSFGAEAAAYIGRRGVITPQNLTPEAVPQQTTAPAQTAAPQEDVRGTGTVPQPQTPQTTAPSPLERAQENYRQTGAVTNSQAEAILADNDAVKTLQDEADLRLPGTKSGNRNAVKAAVARLNGPVATTADGGAQILLDTMADIETDQTQEQAPAQTPAQLTDQTTDQIPLQTAPRTPAATAGDVAPSVEQEVTAQQAQAGETAEAGPESVGAAAAGFTGNDAYYDLLERGEKPARAGDERSGRAMLVPETDPLGRRVSDAAANMYTAMVTTDEMARAEEQLILSGALGFDRQTNREALERAATELAGTDRQTEHNRIVLAAAEGRSAEGDISKAMLLYADYAAKNDTENASEMMVTLSMMANRAGRDLQLFRMMRMLTPEGKLLTVQKTISRTIARINKGRGRNNQQGEVNIPQELQQTYLDAARNADDPRSAAAGETAKAIADGMDEDVQAAADAAVQKADEHEGPLSEVEEMGKRVAERVQSVATEQGTTQEETLFSEIMRIVNENIPETGNRGKGRTTTPNMEALAAYYESIPFFPDVWEAARRRMLDTIQKLPDGSERRTILEEIYERSSRELELKSPADPKSVRRKAAREAATVAGVRMDNRSTTTATAGAKTALRDVLVQNFTNKQQAAQEVARVAVEQTGLSGEAAQKMADDITEAFFLDLAQRGAARVQQLLTPKIVTQNAQKSVAQRLGELYNMGAFNDQNLRQAVMDTVFGKDSGVDVTDELLERYVNAAENELWDAEEAIYKYAGSQIGSTFADKWRAWRYMCMLGNARTQVRNVLGNLAFMPLKKAKDMIGAGLERVMLDQSKRTKAILNTAKRADRDLLDWAKADARNREVHRAMEFSALMGEDTSRGVMMSNQVIFSNRQLEAVRRFWAAVPGGADMIFKNRHYAVSLAGFLKARGYTAEQAASGQVSSEVLSEARGYAIGEAMKATFNDCNAFSDAITSLRYHGKNPFMKGLSVALEGVLPFRRTPANLVVRFAEYSPLGLIKTGADAAIKLRNGEVTVASVIDGLSANLTGTGVAVLGAFLASGAFPIRLRGKVEDEDEKRRGRQSYSLEVTVDGETYSYSIDWIAPTVLPLFLGANLYSAFFEGDEELESFSKFTRFLYSCGTAFEPMLELSCLSSLSDLFEAARYVRSGDPITTVAARIATSLFTMGIPSLLRQAYQATQENERMGFSNTEDPLLRGLERTAENIPFLGAYFQTERINEWGEPQSRGGFLRRSFDAFINPGKLEKVDNSALELEIERLNSVQDKNISPRDFDKTITYTDKEGNVHEDYALTKEEYTTLAQTQGQTAKRILEELVSSAGYDSLTDRQKAKLFVDVYDYARETGRAAALEGYEPNYSDWMEDLEDGGVDALYGRIAGTEARDGISDYLNKPDKQGAADRMEGAYDIFRAMDSEQQTQFLEDNGGRVEGYIRATEAGVSADTFGQIYGEYARLEKSSMGATEKADAWAIYVQEQVERGVITDRQARVIRDSLQYFQNFPADPAKVDDMINFGLDSKAIETVLGEIDLLRPLSGNASVTPAQRYGAIASSDLSDKEKDLAMLAYMPDYDPSDKSPDKTELKYQKIREMGYSPEEYVMFYAAYQAANYAKGKTIENLKSIPGISAGDAELLYRIYSGKYFD